MDQSSQNEEKPLAQSGRSFPRGIEVLIKKAAVDAEFKQLLLAKREEAAREIALELNPTEVLLLRAVPADQLEGIIARTTVPPEHRRAFLGKVAAAMLAALGVGTGGCGGLGPGPAVKGIKPDRPLAPKEGTPDPPKKPDDRFPAPTGIAPDRPMKKEKLPEKKEQDKPGAAPAPKSPPEKPD